MEALQGSLLGAPWGSHGARWIVSHPSRVLRIQDQRTPGTLKGRKSHHPGKKRINWKFFKLKWNSSAPLYSSAQEYCEPGMYSSWKTGRFFLEKTNIFRGKKKSNAISIWKISLMRWPDLYLVPLCWSLPVAKFCQSTKDSALLILRQSLLERQRWKQAQTGKEIWRKQIMLKI